MENHDYLYQHIQLMALAKSNLSLTYYPIKQIAFHVQKNLYIIKNEIETMLNKCQIKYRIIDDYLKWYDNYCKSIKLTIWFKSKMLYNDLTIIKINTNGGFYDRKYFGWYNRRKLSTVKGEIDIYTCENYDQL